MQPHQTLAMFQKTLFKDICIIYLIYLILKPVHKGRMSIFIRYEKRKSNVLITKFAIISESSYIIKKSKFCADIASQFNTLSAYVSKKWHF